VLISVTLLIHYRCSQSYQVMDKLSGSAEHRLQKELV